MQTLVCGSIACVSDGRKSADGVKRWFEVKQKPINQRSLNMRNGVHELTSCGMLEGNFYKKTKGRLDR